VVNGTTEDFYVTFIVKDLPEDRKNILLLSSTNTWNAYNYWPDDASIYTPGITGVNHNRPNPYATPKLKNAVTVHRARDPMKPGRS
jgi:hypothetical protein